MLNSKQGKTKTFGMTKFYSIFRLTEEGKWRVLLLEAGGDETEISDVPALAAYLQLGRMDWKYKTEPQPGRACLGHTNQR